jgi:hypothetical protein
VYRGGAAAENLLQHLDFRASEQRQCDLIIKWEAVPPGIFIPSWILKGQESQVEIFSTEMRNMIPYNEESSWHSIWFTLYNAILESSWDTKRIFLKKRGFVEAVFSAGNYVTRRYSKPAAASWRKIDATKKATIQIVKEYGRQIRDLHKTL